MASNENNHEDFSLDHIEFTGDLTGVKSIEELYLMAAEMASKEKENEGFSLDRKRSTDDETQVKTIEEPVWHEPTTEDSFDEENGRGLNRYKQLNIPGNEAPTFDNPTCEYIQPTSDSSTDSGTLFSIDSTYLDTESHHEPLHASTPSSPPVDPPPSTTEDSFDKENSGGLDEFIQLNNPRYEAPTFDNLTCEYIQPTNDSSTDSGSPPSPDHVSLDMTNSPEPDADPDTKVDASTPSSAPVNLRPVRPVDTGIREVTKSPGQECLKSRCVWFCLGILFGSIIVGATAGIVLGVSSSSNSCITETTPDHLATIGETTGTTSEVQVTSLGPPSIPETTATTTEFKQTTAGTPPGPVTS